MLTYLNKKFSKKNIFIDLYITIFNFILKIQQLKVIRNLTEDNFINESRNLIEIISFNAIRKKNEFHIAVSGGETPIVLYKSLVNLNTDWRKWHFWFCDERCLNENDPELNYQLIYNNLFKDILINSSSIHKINSNLGPEMAAYEYSKILENAPIFDLSILGIGLDGHTASLFPINKSTEVSYGNALAVFNSPKYPSERVSMSISRLCKSDIVVFLAQENKKNILEKFLNEEEMPATKIKGIESTYLITKK